MRAGLSIRALTDALGTNNAYSNCNEHGISQPTAVFLVSHSRFCVRDAECFYEWDDVDEVLPDDYAELAERIREAISLLPLGSVALPLMLGATASDIVQAASRGRILLSIQWSVVGRILTHSLIGC